MSAMNTMFKLPADAKCIALPIAYACTAFSYMVYRTMVKDPETQNLGFYLETPEEASKASSHYNTQVLSLFKNKFHEVGQKCVFNNSGN